MATDPQYDTVHPANQEKEHYGCYNHTKNPKKRYYWATTRNFFSDGSYDLISVRVPVNTSAKCRSFYLWDTDPRCAGCTSEKDMDYKNRMRPQS